MNRTGLTIVLVSSLFAAQVATAQMMGGGGRHGTTPTNPGNPSGGMNGGTSMGDMGAAMGQSLTVGSDGVVYLIRATVATESETPSAEVLAILPAGTTAWTTKLSGRMTRLELAGDFVLVTSGAGDMGINGSNDGDLDGNSRLIALSSASGSVQWQVALDGFVSAVEPFSGGVYALIVRRNGTAGGGMHDGANGPRSMTQSLAAIDNAGKILWSININ